MYSRCRMAPNTQPVLALDIGEWKDLTAAIASVGTVIALIVGAWWAWRRFRRSPESRAYLGIDVIPMWEESGGRAFVRAHIVVTNRGGKKQKLLAAADGQVSRLACWWLDSGADRNGALTNGYADWSRAPAVSARLLGNELVLRPQDTWDETVLFAAPDTAKAARVLGFVYVSGRYRLLRRPHRLPSFTTAAAVVVKGGHLESSVSGAAGHTSPSTSADKSGAATSAGT